MKFLKKILENILGLGCIFALFLASAENEDGSCNLAWSLGCLAVAVICGWLWSKFFDKDASGETTDKGTD